MKIDAPVALEAFIRVRFFFVKSTEGLSGSWNFLRCVTDWLDWAFFIRIVQCINVAGAVSMKFFLDLRLVPQCISFPVHAVACAKSLG